MCVIISYLISYFVFVPQGLEYCEERYSQELSGTAYPLRAQATSTRLLTCQTIEKFRPHLDRDDSMNEGKPASEYFILMLLINNVKLNCWCWKINWIINQIN